jgi:hypothetical protein
MRDDRRILANVLDFGLCPIKKRRERNRLWRGIVIALALEAAAAVAGTWVILQLISVLSRRMS